MSDFQVVFFAFSPKQLWGSGLLFGWLYFLYNGAHFLSRTAFLKKFWITNHRGLSACPMVSAMTLILRIFQFLYKCKFILRESGEKKFARLSFVVFLSFFCSCSIGLIVSNFIHELVVTRRVNSKILTAVTFIFYALFFSIPLT